MENSQELERYGTIERWSKELGLSKTSIHARLKDVEGITGKSPDGRVIEHGFFSASDVRARCADLLLERPEADAQGFIVLEEEESLVRYGTIRSWSRELDVTERISAQLEHAPFIEGRMPGGQVFRFYAESIVRSFCARTLEQLPSSDASGFFVASWQGQPERFGTIYSWAGVLGLPGSTMRRKLRTAPRIEGRDCGGQRRHFIPEMEVRKACADILVEMPQADRTGFIDIQVTEEKKERLGYIRAWGKTLGISKPAIKRRLQSTRGITGKDFKGHVLVDGFYAESVVRRACADLLSPPRDGES